MTGLGTKSPFISTLQAGDVLLSEEQWYLQRQGETIVHIAVNSTQLQNISKLITMRDVKMMINLLSSVERIISPSTFDSSTT